jgi:glycine/D-amino acid oxidase-like deaminating enzyme
MEQTHEHVIICGGGVIGAAIANYLSLRGVAATDVERCRVACAASGKAGGFLALDWCDNTPLAALARQSFALRAQLPQALGMDYGYRRLTTLAVAVQAQNRRAPAPLQALWPGWTALVFPMAGWEPQAPRPTAACTRMYGSRLRLLGYG